MREIKFRVWDNEQQEYPNTDILHIKNDGTLLISKKGENPWSALLSSGCNSERFVIEFSTGLKDKNGTEIYEGDVVQTPEYPGKIVYNKKYACFELWRPRSSDCFIALTHQQDIDMGDLEVVGNIHKNSELME